MQFGCRRAIPQWRFGDEAQARAPQVLGGTPHAKLRAAA